MTCATSAMCNALPQRCAVWLRELGASHQVCALACMHLWGDASWMYAAEEIQCTIELLVRQVPHHVSVFSCGCCRSLLRIHPGITCTC